MTKGADKWIYDHVMDCLVWVANQISQHREHIHAYKLWYEPTKGNKDMTVNNNVDSELLNVAAVAEVTSKDLLQVTTSDPQPVDSRSVIHD